MPLTMIIPDCSFCVLFAEGKQACGFALQRIILTDDFIHHRNTNSVLYRQEGIGVINWLQLLRIANGDELATLCGDLLLNSHPHV